MEAVARANVLVKGSKPARANQLGGFGLEHLVHSSRARASLNPK